MNEIEQSLAQLLFEYKTGQIDTNQCIKEIEQIFQHGNLK